MKKETMEKKANKILREEAESLDWPAAKRHLDEKIEQYKNLIGQEGVNPFAALMQLHRLKGRYNQGLRTPELYRDIMKFE